MGNSTASDNDAVGACCNIVLWDILIAAITSGFAFSKLVHLHWALCVILAIIVGIAVGFLMLVRFLGTIIQFGFSIIWCIGLEEILEEIFGIYQYLDKDSTKMWAIRAGAVLIIFGFHLCCNFIITGGVTFFLGFLGEDFLENRKYKREAKRKKHKEKKIRKKKRDICYDKLEQEIKEAYLYKKKLDDIRDRISKLVEKNGINMEEWEKIYKCVFVETENIYYSIEDEKKYYSTRPKKRCKQINSVITDIHNKSMLIEQNTKYMEQNILMYEKRMAEEERKRSYQKEKYNYKPNHDEKNNSKYYFAGCNDMKSYEKRYKELAKIYHPDSPNGDKEIFQEIQNIYDKVCSELKSAQS